MDLLNKLIIVSEKAANIARLCRQNQHLFQLLIQKKSCNEANPRFVEDFKTLADVLIQEMIKHEIGEEFPELRSSIHGEENNIFCNKLGESISVEIKNTPKETADLLKIVLNGDEEAAKLLATEVHKKVSLNEVNTNQNLPNLECDIKNLGIWIDPIDSTAEYINGHENISDSGISTNGLNCVTVLLGVFKKDTGLPYIGIVNQPFFIRDISRWRGSCIWGIVDSNTPSQQGIKTNIISVSSSERAEIIEKLKREGFSIIEAAGAGYKILSVIAGLADAYVLTKNSTFKWDTCGPQAILKSIGGDVIVFDEAINKSIVSVKYLENDDTCNLGGIIAYREADVLEKIMNCLEK